jgi:hypothetical protein
VGPESREQRFDCLGWKKTLINRTKEDEDGNEMRFEMRSKLPVGHDLSFTEGNIAACLKYFIAKLKIIQHSLHGWIMSAVVHYLTRLSERYLYSTSYLQLDIEKQRILEEPTFPIFKMPMDTGRLEGNLNPRGLTLGSMQRCLVTIISYSCNCSLQVQIEILS